MGCCVVTNLRGSARNSVDVPIEATYKIDDEQGGFEEKAASLIRSIFGAFDAHSARFESFRTAIRGEETAFDAAVREHFA